MARATIAAPPALGEVRDVYVVPAIIPVVAL
jgi:hypothetical protein